MAFVLPYMSQKAYGRGAAGLFHFLVSSCNVDVSGCFKVAVELTGVDYTPNHASGPKYAHTARELCEEADAFPNMRFIGAHNRPGLWFGREIVLDAPAEG
jgi:hypothetical protein